MIIFCVAVLYFSAGIYFYRQRGKVSFLTRSPITVTISLFVLGLDSIMNTLIFSEINWGDEFRFECYMGVAATVVGQFGFELATGMRIFRISKVYNKYLSFLES